MKSLNLKIAFNGVTYSAIPDKFSSTDGISELCAGCVNYTDGVCGDLLPSGISTICEDLSIKWVREDVTAASKQVSIGQVEIAAVKTGLSDAQAAKLVSTLGIISHPQYEEYTKLHKLFGGVII